VIAGSLEIQMAMNLARLADDMNKSKSMVSSTMKDIEGAVASAKSAWEPSESVWVSAIS